MRTASALACVLLAAGCAATTPQARSVARVGPWLAPSVSAAFREEAIGDPAKAMSAYEDVVRSAAEGEPDAFQIATLEAALDALVFRAVGPFADVTSNAALVFRTEEPSLLAGATLADQEHASGTLARALADSYSAANGPFARGLVARAMTGAAEHRGDTDDAARWRERTGCAREATVIGPLDWAPLTGVYEPDPLEAFDAPLVASAPHETFHAPAGPTTVRGRGCAIDLSTTSALPGVRDVVVDVSVPKGGRIGVSLRSPATAILSVGGKRVLSRPYELGGGHVARYGWADVDPGVVRIVARVGTDADGEDVEIDAWDAAGAPLKFHAPGLGERANAAARSGEVLVPPAPSTHDERLLVALAALAAADPRTAESSLEGVATGPKADPDLALVYGRAVDAARDLSLVERTERARAAYARVRAAWPSSWEATLSLALLAGAKRGPDDARFAELSFLDQHDHEEGGPLVDLFDFLTSGRAHLWDRALAARDRASKSLGRSPLFDDVDRAVIERSTADRVANDCGASKANDHAGLDCYEALLARGNVKGALGELERVRVVTGALDRFLPATARHALAIGDRDALSRAIADMLPAELTLSAIFGAAALDPQRAVPSLDTPSRLLSYARTAHDAPTALGPLLHALGGHPTAEFDGIAEAETREDRAHPAQPGAGTLLLRHVERYDVSPVGLTHAVLFDLRRVGGTTDVEENAQAAAPEIAGRTALRILRRRIWKKNGTVVEPEPNPGASQAHADLAQLEAGDVVEAIYEGWSIPDQMGEMGIDTPDLLPERTGVKSATIEIHYPKETVVSLYAHPALGEPKISVMGNEKVLRFSLVDHGVRRVEVGTPRMDRGVSVSLGTSRWSEIARGLREAIASLSDHDPAFDQWARAAVSAAKAETDREKISAVVAATGASVKEGSPGELADFLYGHSLGPQSTTARSILAEHQGSRTWVIVQALRDLGIPCEVVVAENEPWSAAATFPPHAGRFVHPLVLAHARGADGIRDVWIDADISGPPLPPGHISPELRGRLALHEDGSIAPLPDLGANTERDEVDERLTVDARGDAHGLFTIVLRGREAQDLAEALLREVGDERQRALRNVVLSWVPFVNVEKVDLSSTEGSWQIAIRAEVTVPGYAQAEGKPSAKPTTWTLPGLDPVHEVYPRGSSRTLAASYATEATRENPLAVNRAVQYHFHRRVELPAGATNIETPGPYDLRGEHLSARRTFTVSGDVILDDVTLDVPTGTVPAAEYGAFATVVHRTDDAFLAEVRARWAIPASTARP